MTVTDITSVARVHTWVIPGTVVVPRDGATAVIVVAGLAFALALALTLARVTLVGPARSM
jgi:hypothetical protein